MDPEGTRIGDAERQQVIDVLRRAASDGRLTLDEFAERTGDVFAARTRGDLDRVVDDLPPGVRAPAPAPPSARPAPSPSADTARRPGGRRRFVAIMGGSRPRGRWRAAEKITAFAFWGGVTLDLRHALIESPTVEISAWAIMGGVNVVVPEGIPVELDGFVLMGGSHDGTRPGRIVEGAPVVRVRARGLWGGVNAWTRRERSGRPGDPRTGDVEDGDLDGSDADRRHFGMRMPPFPPLPRLPGPSLDDLVPPMPGRRGHRHGHPRSRTARRAERADPAGSRASDAGPGVRTETAAQDEPGETAARAQPAGGTFTVLVTDICRSTEFATRLGDQRWFGVLQDHNALVREQVRRHHGTEVKAQGDGFLVTFTSARQAVLAAIAIQRAMAEYRRAHPEHPIELRTGLHTGEVVEDHGDIVGQNVVVAVRIADQARPGEILVSSLTKDLTDAGGDLRFDDGREAELKGVARTWRVHAVAWE